MTMIKKYIEDKEGNQILPITHFSAVKDSDGNTLEDVLWEEKEYDPTHYSGLGKVVLKKNMVSGVNTLTQSMINQANTIYVIRYDFVLDSDITVPANCILDFQGGSISASGNTLNYNWCTLQGDVKLYLVGQGRPANTTLYAKWFGLVGDGTTDNYPLFNRVKDLLLYKELVLDGANYYISDTIVFDVPNITIKGVTKAYHGSSGAAIVSDNDIVFFKFTKKGYYVEGVSFINQGSSIGNTVGIRMSEVEDSEKDTVTDGTKASVDSVVEKCVFYNLSKGIYTCGTQARISRCSFLGGCKRGIVLDALTNSNDTYPSGESNISPLVYGSTSRSNVIDHCNFHGMDNTSYCIEAISNRCIGIVIENCHQDCEAGFYKGILYRSKICDNAIYGSTTTVLYLGRVEDSVISNNTIESSITSQYWAESKKTIPMQVVLNSTVGIANSTISGNVFGDCNDSHIILPGFQNATITGNVFKNWGKTYINTEDEDPNTACIKITDRNLGSSGTLTICGNSFICETEANVPSGKKAQETYIFQLYDYTIRNVSITSNSIGCDSGSRVKGYYIYDGSRTNNYRAFIDNNIVFGVINVASSAARPTNTELLYPGFRFYDTTLHRTIFWSDENKWINADGTPVT